MSDVVAGRRCRSCGEVIHDGCGHNCKGMVFKPQKQGVNVTGIWLHAVFNEHGEWTDKMRVCAEVNGEWRECIVEAPIGHCSHIVEPGGILRAPVVSVPGVPALPLDAATTQREVQNEPT